MYQDRRKEEEGAYKTSWGEEVRISYRGRIFTGWVRENVNVFCQRAAML